MAHASAFTGPGRLRCPSRRLATAICRSACAVDPGYGQSATLLDSHVDELPGQPDDSRSTRSGAHRAIVGIATDPRMIACRDHSPSSGGRVSWRWAMVAADPR